MDESVHFGSHLHEEVVVLRQQKIQRVSVIIWALKGSLDAHDVADALKLITRTESTRGKFRIFGTRSDAG